MADSSQNKYNYLTAKSVVEKMTEKEKTNKIRKLEEKGYEYNPYIEILIEEETIIPYDFILLSLLQENTKND